MNLSNNLAQIVGLVIIVVDALVSFLLAQTNVQFSPEFSLGLGAISVVVTTAGLYLNVRMPGQDTNRAPGQAAVGYIGRIIVSVVVAVIVGLLLTGLLGPILAELNVPIVDIVGGFFTKWGWALGILAGLWYFFAGRWPPS